MTPKEFLTAFFGKTYNLPADKVASLLNDEGTEIKAEALTTLLELDVAKVQKMKEENQTYFENGQKKATKELMTDWEKKLKEKHGVTSDKKGEDLFEEIITLKSNDKSSVDEAKVKSHAAYVAMQNELNNKIVETDNTWKSKWDTHQKEVAKKETFSGVLKKADTFLPGFALPENEQLKANQKRLLEIDLQQYDYEPQAGSDDFIVKTKEGKLLEDGHGNRITYEALVKQTASKYWLPIEGQARQGAGGKNNAAAGAATASAWKGKQPTNDAEYTNLIREAKDPKDRIAIQDSYKAFKEGSKQ